MRAMRPLWMFHWLAGPSLAWLATISSPLHLRGRDLCPLPCHLLRNFQRQSRRRRPSTTRTPARLKSCPLRPSTLTLRRHDERHLVSIVHGSHHRRLSTPLARALTPNVCEVPDAETLQEVHAACQSSSAFSSIPDSRSLQRASNWHVELLEVLCDCCLEQELRKSCSICPKNRTSHLPRQCCRSIASISLLCKRLLRMSNAIFFKNVFKVTHFAGCAILFNKDTFYPDISVK